jgi:RNA polymerase sigma-70 factor (ECF subfamily)
MSYWKKESPSEEELILGCEKGNSKSQELLYRQYYGYAMTICLSYSGSRDEASEILNEAFFKVFNKIHTYKKGSSFKAWLRRTVVNTAIDYFRANKKFMFNVEMNEAITEETDSDIVNDITAQEIFDLLQRLPEKYRITFNLFELEGYSHEEISEILNIPVGTSRSNLARAKQRLRELVTQHYNMLYGKCV